MNPHAPGARVYVRWTDGGMYPATVCAFSQGYVQVRFDSGGTPAWVLPAQIATAAPAPGAAHPPASPASHGPQYRGPQGWGAPAPAQAQAPAPAPAALVSPAAGPPVAAPPAARAAASASPASPVAAPPVAAPPVAAPPAARAAAASASPLPRSLPGPPPVPMKGEIAGVPRGLLYPPIGRGPGAGKAFFFFSGFVTSTDTDMAMRMTDIEHLGDDVAALRAAGFSVVVDLHGELTGLNQALAGTHPDAPGLECAGIFWSGHGDDDGTLQDYQGFRIKPDEIAPDATARASVKLFVQSACYVGGAVASWQKALGQQALIIGWGAPLSNDRAVDFLTPDEESSKDFDDLLRRHLGVSAVIEDGPLHEIRELAQKHEAKTAVLLLDFDDLVEAVNARTKNLIKKEGKVAFFGVLALPSKERPDQRRKQLVRVQAVGISDVFVSVTSLVGPYSDALDLPRAIRMLDSEPWVKLTLSKIVGPSAGAPAEFVLLESVHRRRRLDPLTLARSIISVGILADRLEDLFFGSDVR